MGSELPSQHTVGLKDPVPGAPFVPDGFVGASDVPEGEEPELAEVPDGALVAVGTAMGEPY